MSLFSHACSKLLALSRYIYFKASKESMFSSVPTYLNVAIKRRTIGYLSKIMKRGLSFECSFVKSYMLYKQMVLLGPIKEKLIHV